MDDVHLLVQGEGRTARNQVAFHVPIKVGLRKPPTCPRLVSTVELKKTTEVGQLNNRAGLNSQGSSATRIRSASTGRDKKSELQARYWAFLFGNLQRAVDEIYSTCETDESVTECKEAILVLENYMREFVNLIEWFQVKQDYENTSPPQRPTSLTWEVRKSNSAAITTPTQKSESLLGEVTSPDQTMEKESVNGEGYNLNKKVEDTSNVLPSESDIREFTNVHDLIPANITALEESVIPEPSNPNVVIQELAPPLSIEAEPIISSILELPVITPSVVEAPMELTEEYPTQLESTEPVVLMVSEASQTDLELCIEGADGLRFLPPPSTIKKKPPPTILPQPVTVVPSHVPTSGRPLTHGAGQATQQPSTVIRPNYASVSSRVVTKRSVPPQPKRASATKTRSRTSLEQASWAEKVKDQSPAVSVDVLPRTGNSSLEDEGWETVKGRSRSRFSTASNLCKAKQRYNQISGSSSLPALSLSEVELYPPHQSKRNKEKDNCREKRKSEEERNDIDIMDNLNADTVLETKLQEELRELSFEAAKLRQEIKQLETDQNADDAELPTPQTESSSLEAAPYQNVLVGMSSLERQQIQDYVARNPGRAGELHQKLSSPSRHRSLQDTLRRFQMKQSQAKEKREKLAQERTNRLKELHMRVEEVCSAQEANTEKRRILLETKQKRADTNRQQHLKTIVRKAHDEEQKLKEIAFITGLEAQNKRHEFLVQWREQQERLHGIAEERQRKLEEKAAKEAAVEERRRLIEAQRIVRLEKMQVSRREREERVGRAQQEKEKERQELAREKARDREERLSALHAAQLATQEELQKKIQLKQEESARRHEENMEHIRQRALESSILRTDDAAPWLVPYQVLKLCEICNVLIGSEVYLVSHLRGRKHTEAVQAVQKNNQGEEIAVLNIRYIVDAPADKLDPRIAIDKKRVQALKKRCKKIRQKMTRTSLDFEKEAMASKEDASIKDESIKSSAKKPRLAKSLKDIDKLFKSQGKGQWPNPAITSLERALGEINRVLSKPGPDCTHDQDTFSSLEGFNSINNILSLGLDVPPNMAQYLPNKCFVTACTCLNLVCRDHVTNSRYLLMSKHFSTILDLLLNRLSNLLPEVPNPSPTPLAVDALGDALMRVVALVLSIAAPLDSCDVITSRVQDVISYTVSVGVVDKLALYCSGVRDPIDNAPQAAQFLLSGLELLSTLTARCVSSKCGGRDPTQLLVTLQVTELVGAVSMLYGMLLHEGGPPRNTAPPPLPPHAVQVTLATVHLLTHIAELDLQMFQSVLGAEGISLQFRHIASYLLWYSTHDRTNDQLLHAVVIMVGFFAVHHRDNQIMLQSGCMPTVLQQLCNLPLPYFVNPTLEAILFPTLLACCLDNPENRAILEQEIAYQTLEDFKASEFALNNRLMQIVLN